jgi:hypothetical protein
MGSMNRRGGLLAAAIALLFHGSTAAQGNGLNEREQGQRLMYNLRYHYRTAGQHRGSSNAASLKRASMKRRNCAKRNRSASQ